MRMWQRLVKLLNILHIFLRYLKQSNECLCISLERQAGGAVAASGEHGAARGAVGGRVVEWRERTQARAHWAHGQVRPALQATVDANGNYSDYLKGDGKQIFLVCDLCVQNERLFHDAIFLGTPLFLYYSFFFFFCWKHAIIVVF